MLDPVIHQTTRLRLMTALYRNREARFTSLRDGLGLTDGNLASHAGVLEKAGYVASRRALTAAGFELRYQITPAGSEAYRAYVQELKALLDEPSPPAGTDAGRPQGRGEVSATAGPLRLGAGDQEDAA